MTAAKRVGIYMRVSTRNGGQTVENQRQALTAAAERRGWQIVAGFCDDGISGAKGRGMRPAFDRLHKAIVGREIDVIAAWSVDRLGRSLHRISLASLARFMVPGWTCTSIGKASIRARWPGRRCFRCSGYSPSLNEPSFVLIHT